MFTDFGHELPLPTRITVSISNFVKSNSLYMLGAIVIFSIAMSRLYKTEKGRLFLDRFSLKLPVFGILIRKVAVAKFTRTMSTMLTSGVAILEALDIVAKTSGNKVIETALYNVRTAIAEGQTMAEPLSDTAIFPSMVCQMIAVGETTGALDAMLEKIAQFYDEEVDQAVSNLTAMIEPVMMVFLGTVIGGLVISMYLPIFKIAGVVSG
ncbi:MAG: type II secretion system F family protein [Nitrospinales bacterium]